MSTFVVPDTAEIVTIPIDSLFPWYSFNISLSGVTYILSFRYNLRMQRWIMDIADALTNPILSGLPLLIGVNITGRFNLLNMPVGIFYVTDDTGAGNQPTQYSFGITHTLHYYDPLGIT